MNCDTGHLVRDFTPDLLDKGYIAIPKELEHAASCALHREDQTYISLTSGAKLSQWARKQRKHKKYMQKQSRKANRG